jgi:hypothetical protein
LAIYLLSEADFKRAHKWLYLYALSMELIVEAGRVTGEWAAVGAEATSKKKASAL